MPPLLQWISALTVATATFCEETHKYQRSWALTMVSWYGSCRGLIDKEDELIADPKPTAESRVEEIAPAVFEQAVAQADIAISITDPSANIVYVNPAFARVTGFSAEELVAANQSVLSNKSTPPELYAEMWSAISQGQAWSGRLVNRRKDGSKYLADLLITPVTNSDGKITNYLGIQRDITPLHRLECALADQKAIVEAMVDAAPIVIALLDSRQQVVLDNQEYKKLVSDMRVVEPAEVILNAVKAGNRALLDQPAIGQCAFHDHEIAFDSTSGRRWFSCTGTWVQRIDAAADTFFDRQDEVYLALICKETTNLHAEQEKARLAMLRAVMAEEERVESIRESLSAAAFKIEGPINVIASVLATLKRQGKAGAAEGALSEVLAAGRQAVDCLRHAVPAGPSESFSTVNLNEIVRDVIDLSEQRLLACGIELAWIPQAVLPSVTAYRARMRSLFKSLIDNAIDSMNTLRSGQRSLRIVTNGWRDRVEVTIEDSGPGIPADLRYKVFEPFFSTRGEGGAHLGTGLSSAQQIVADHDGAIEIETPAGGGCRVRVVLPVKR